MAGSGFKHTKIGHFCPQILTKFENCKPAHTVGAGKEGYQCGTLPAPVL